MKHKEEIPPKKKEWCYDIQKVSSATEQTGMIPSAILTENEAEAYESIYPIVKQKPIK